MITLTGKRNDACFAEFVWEGDARIRSYRLGLEQLFHGRYLETMLVPFTGQAVLLIGCGKKEDFAPGLTAVKEVLAATAAKCRDFNIRACSMDVSCFTQLLGPEAFTAAVLGLGLGCYRYRYQPLENEEAMGLRFPAGKRRSVCGQAEGSAGASGGDLLCQKYGEYAGKPPAAHGF